jgi:hypothetical protein
MMIATGNLEFQKDCHAALNLSGPNATNFNAIPGLGENR